MGKVIGWVIAIAVVVWAATFGVSIFLSPDDLAKCDNIPSERQDCNPADVIVAISGGDTTARANSAIELYKNGWAGHIIFSGASADPSAPSNAHEMREIALSSDVPFDDITLDETSRTTIENAHNVAEILEDSDWGNIILTTSSYHLRRSKMVFESSGDITVRTAAVRDSIWDDVWWITPRGWYLAANELGGILMFYISGAGQ